MVRARSSTAESFNLRTTANSVLNAKGLSAALDCDVLVCWRRPTWPRYLLNVLAYSHLIPVIDGGIMSTVKRDGTPQHVSWSIHTSAQTMRAWSASMLSDAVTSPLTAVEC